MRFTDLSVVFYYTANSNPLVLGKSQKFRFMMGVKLNWFSLGETALVFMYTYSEKYQPRFLEGDKSSLSNLMKNCWSFDAVPKSFAVFGLDFA